MNRPLRIALIATATVAVLAAGAGGVFLASFDPNSLKPRIVEAVKRATGRDLRLNGKIALQFALRPTILVDDVAFANPPGFSRPDMARLQSLQLELGLLPLLFHRIEIDRLVLVHPDILLETTASGQSNWQLTPERAPEAGPPAVTPSTPASPATTQAPAETTVSVSAIRIQDGTLAYRDDATGKLTTLMLSRLRASSATPDSPLHLDADAVYNNTKVTLDADTGSLSRLQQQTATSPWPAKLTFTADGATLTAEGAFTRPLQAKGYTLAVTATVPDAGALAPLLPSTALPQGAALLKLHDIAFAAKLADTGGPTPDISAVTLHIGPSDLGAQIPGLLLAKLDIDAPRPDQPMTIDVAATLGSTPLAITGTIGAPTRVLPNAASSPYPVDVTLRADGATATAKGTVANAQALTGLNLAVAATIPDLAALAPLAFRPLPPLKSVAFQANLTDAPAGLRQGATLRDLHLTGPDGDVSGTAAIAFGTRPSLTADLRSNRFDLDALRAAIDQTPASPPTAGAPVPASAPRPPQAANPPKARRDERLFSTSKLPFAPLRSADADLKLAIADLHTGGADYKSVSTHAVLANGKLTVDPFTADLPGGHLAATVSVDAAQPSPPVHVVLHAPGLALKTLLAATGQPAYATGNLEIQADLSGTGDSPHDIAATLDGSIGLAVAGGTIDNRLLGSLLGKLMDSLNALDLVGRGGTSELKCFALRMDANHGIGAVQALALSSSLLTMTGAGSVNLGAETLAMALRPQARLAGTALVIPVAVSGPIRNPAVKVNDLKAAESNAGTVAGAIIGNATPLGILGGLLGADKLAAGTQDVCPASLAAARFQSAPPAAAPAQAKPANPTTPPNPATLLKNLFR